MNKLDKLINREMKRKNANEVPVFAIVFNNEDDIISFARNDRHKKNKISGHAEINAINKAMRKLKRQNLSGKKIFVSLEPCTMCYSAIKQSKIKEVLYILENKKMSFRNEILIDTIDLNIKKISNLNDSKYKEKIKEFFKVKR